ncbi:MULTISPECIES: hypothetical protein [unclassified Rhodococcus (in: high G+C Gram-positive bacteria)]|uniref:hypothetical protein n=1 Tax=unclassified Rhodococcus (in: high G+C Gram-positive bacteria) TaxID=192944 RepID=UPI00117A6F0C|nr:MULTISPECIES: hypothetical protein [unclassified Rhodococcus (in: high G+C Gram-positive bacteria)]
MSTSKLLDHWSAPAGSGSAVACLATTYTFEPEFFTNDCLSRFLALSAVTGEGDKISTIAATLEEELRLSETTAVSVLVDRGTRTDHRNLRWDLIPVAVSTGLLHSKVAVLLWERHARIVVGSANLTPAGYRHKIETAVAFDISEGCQVPQAVLLGIVEELRSYLRLLPAAAESAIRRALDTLDRVTARIDEHAPTTSNGPAVHFAVAPSAPGRSPLAVYQSVWRTTRKPLRASILSPFWDAATSDTAVSAVRALLTGQPSSSRKVTAVVGKDRAGAFMAPEELASQVDRVRELEPFDKEPRALHAKTLLLENDEWVAGLIGSSNATAAGWGLKPAHGHRELNVWIGAPRKSPTGRALQDLVKSRLSVDLTAVETVIDDEDEIELPSVPLFFSWCALELTATTARILLWFEVARGEPDAWTITVPAGSHTFDHQNWRSLAQPPHVALDIDRSSVPSFVEVTWIDKKGHRSAQWVSNVDDTSMLPIPADLADLPADLLLDALGSTRPIPVEVERRLRQEEARRIMGVDSSDALKRHDATGLLLQRTRARSAALWAMRERLSRRVTSIEVLRSRLFGVIGPVEISRLLTVDQLSTSSEKRVGTPPGSVSETHFLLAEIALTLGSVDWRTAFGAVDYEDASAVVTEALTEISSLQETLAVESVESDMLLYVADAFEEARKSCGI